LYFSPAIDFTCSTVSAVAAMVMSSLLGVYGLNCVHG
jgi:hypothetical protein